MTRVLKHHRSRGIWVVLAGFSRLFVPPIILRWVEDEVESACSQVPTAERLLHETLASVHRNILCLVWVSLRREIGSCPYSNGFLHASSFSYILFLQLLSQGSTDVPVLLAEVARAREVATAVEATRAVAMLTAEASTRQAIAVPDSATFHVGDVEDWATLVEREALESVSRAEAKNAMALATAREDAKRLVRKMSLLEVELAAERWAREVSEREHQA
jgi:hypothetical protein